jgi:hypothetical protein
MKLNLIINKAKSYVVSEWPIMHPHFKNPLYNGPCLCLNNTLWFLSLPYILSVDSPPLPRAPAPASEETAEALLPPDPDAAHTRSLSDSKM